MIGLDPGHCKCTVYKSLRNRMPSSTKLKKITCIQRMIKLVVKGQMSQMSVKFYLLCLNVKYRIT